MAPPRSAPPRPRRAQAADLSPHASGPGGSMMPAPPAEEYSRIITPEAAVTEEMEDVCSMLAECLEMRRRWLFKPLGGAGAGG